MSKINFPKKQEQRLIPKYLLEYAEELQENHPDPSAEWGGGSGGDTIQAGTGITITTESDDTKTISIDETVVAVKSDITEVTANTGLTPSATLTDIQVGDTVYEIPQGGGATYTAGTGIDITGSTISVVASDVVTAGNITIALGYTPSYFSGNYENLTNKPDLSIYAESADLATVATTGDYDDLLDKPDLSIYAETSSLGDCAYLDQNELSIDYSQITSTPIIPTSTSQLNNDSGFITSADLPTNHVTTDTAQTITAAKTFQGDQLIRFKESSSGDIMGFTSYAAAGEVGNLQTKYRSFRTRNDTNSKYKYITTLGDDSYNRDAYVGFRVKTTSGTTARLNFIAPHLTYDQMGTYYPYGHTNDTYYIPMVIKTDVGSSDYLYADERGVLDISSVIPTVTSDLINDRFVRYDTSSQGLTSTQKSNARTNIGAGTSNFSGSYSDLTNKPTIPTATSDLTNDSGFITGINSSDVTTALGFTPYSSSNPDGYITGITSGDVTTALGYTPGTSNFSGDYTDLTNKPDLSIYAQSSNLATVATSGSYNDLSNKPTIPAAQIQSDWDQSDNTAVDYIKNKPDSEPLYVHSVTLVNNGSLSSSTARAISLIINNDPTPFDTTTLYNYLSNHGYTTTSNGILSASGSYYVNSTNVPVIGIRGFSNSIDIIATKGNDWQTTISVVYKDNVQPLADAVGISLDWSNITNKPTIPSIEYANGDTYENRSHYQLYGYATNGGKDLQFTVTFNKSLANISSVTVNKITIITRGISGYVGPTSYTDYAADTTNYTVTALISSDNAITITIRANSAWSNVNNNTPVCAVVQNVVGALKLTFNS